jgi:MFS family permease
MRRKGERDTIRSTRAPLRARAQQSDGWLTPALARVLTASACWGFAFSSFYLLPTFMDKELAAGPDTIGVIIGIFGISTVLFTPLAGRCVDDYPRRYCVAAGAAIMALASLGFLFVESVGTWLIALRVAQGLSYALVLVAVGTLVADNVRPERLSQALGLSGASMLVMNALGPAIAEPLASVAGWKPVFALSALTASLSGLLALRVPESRPEHHAAVDGYENAARLLDVLRRPLARHYAIIMALCGAVFGSVMTFEQPYARELGRQYVGGFFVAFGASALFIRFFFGSVPDRHGRHRVGTLALGTYAVAVLALALPVRAWLEVVGALFGLAHGLLYPSINAIAVTGVAAGERGRIMAIFTGSFNLGMWAGATSLGLTAGSIGYEMVFVLTGAIALIATCVFAFSPALRSDGEVNAAHALGRYTDRETAMVDRA